MRNYSLPSTPPLPRQPPRDQCREAPSLLPECCRGQTGGPDQTLRAWCSDEVLKVPAEGRGNQADIPFVPEDIRRPPADQSREKGSTYIVIPCGPAGVQLHVELPLLPRQLVVFCLLLSRQRVPLEGTWGGETERDMQKSPTTLRRGGKAASFWDKSVRNRTTCRWSAGPTTGVLGQSTGWRLCHATPCPLWGWGRVMAVAVGVPSDWPASVAEGKQTGTGTPCHPTCYVLVPSPLFPQ